MDAGPIYRQKTLPILDNETKQSLYDRLSALGKELLINDLPHIISGELEARSQPHPDRATFTKKISKSDGLIDWNKTAENIYREIRAYQGWPGSRTVIAGKEVIITEAHVVPSTRANQKPGDITAKKEAQELSIATSSGTICIDTLKPAGKKEMPIRAFLAGYGSQI